MIMKININNEEYVINVENETLMEELFNSLPEKFSMTELNGNEKYYYLNSNMKNANRRCVLRTEKRIFTTLLTRYKCIFIIKTDTKVSCR